ncbi:hormogonium polysaccharide biosynthesis protein HpsA [Laspinema sp. D1]|uniref:hormogonium polysaccharide biosynthesis protein HpsA n=1 Tax=Laspinema palackyanum TaxID=3231601 RepID=UPI00346D0526|nr:hormogonium polysaccharide biosynthesis protein HpsA [Laspinema sp. D2b]
MARKHKIQKALTHLVQAIIRFAQKLTSRDTYRFLRTAFVTSRRRLQAGFVLPTTTLLIIVMILVVSTLIFRSYQRSTDAITQFQRQQVVNSAAPAIDRAKAKLELLFNDKNVPDVGETDLEKDLLDDALYTFLDEERITLPGNQGNAQRNIAWKYPKDGKGDTTTVYTIVLRTSTGTEEKTQETMDPALLKEGVTLITDDQKKAERLLVRNGPLLEGLNSNQSNTQACQIEPQDDESGGAFGWFPLGTALFKKNFQVYALSVPNSVANGQATANRSIATVQYQQDRTFEGLNKWGAWFRSDLEVTPGFNFNWNGAVHSEGNLFFEPDKNPQRPNDKFRLYLLSSENSCFYKPESNSEVSTWGHLVYGAIAGKANNPGPVNLDVYSSPTTLQDVNAAKDSTTTTTNFLAMSLNPSKILTNNKSEPRDPKFNLEATTDTEYWDSDANLLKTRVNIGKVSPPPYVDDTYRADNLYGPKPGYEPPEIIKNPPARDTYSVEPTQNMGSALSDPELTREEPPSLLKPNDYGLDGYWERRARGQGLRVIVGERLELGNTFGWKGDADPLYPQDTAFVTPTSPDGRNKGAHEFRQQRTLRDNLAAVQATAVYHKGQGDGKTPAAIVATTVHPGTVETLKNSATFETFSFTPRTGTEFDRLRANNIIATDFFNGRGTNGWEFEVPNLADSQVARQNLAEFAGDTGGAFPITQQDRVYPDPEWTMWGNFSSLRRNNGSLADNTTQQTAAATLGMLAYNINYLQSYDYGAGTGLDGTADELEKLADALSDLQDGDTENGELDGANPSDPTTYNQPPEEYIANLEAQGVDSKIIDLARFVMTKEQIERDRTFGFRVSRANHPANPTGLADPVACDITTDGNRFFGYNALPTTQPDLNRLKGLSRLCSNQPKFPSLYYLFPVVDHGHQGGQSTINAVNIDHRQPDGTNFPGPPDPDPAEPYVTDAQARGNNSATRYKAVSNADIGKMAIRPKPVANWVLPTTPNPTVTNTDAVPNDNGRELVRWRPATGTATNIQVAIKDSALYNGREHMNVRALNLDLDMLRKDDKIGGESWLSKSGIVYAFREDAVREDAIARPGVAYNPDPLTGLPAVMRAVGTAPTDPQLTDKGISLKPVDYYADPDRRPYGFRLKNGSDIRHDGTNRGLTIVSDQPIYIQGDFNLHGEKPNNQNRFQEFTQALNPDFGNFYGRTDLNPKFSRSAPDSDPWRPTEIIGDAITILSENFCDGSIEDGIIFSHQVMSTPKTTILQTGNNYGCGVPFTSYLNQNRPNSGTTAQTWRRENLAENPPAGERSTSPIAISRNGQIMINAGMPPAPAPYNGNYYRFDNFPWSGKPLNKTPPDTWVNAVLVNGVVPSRQNQSNGGLHNFPRMLEDWQIDSKNNTNLHILGSFIQLNFSNYATGPYEHDAWEPVATPVAGKTTSFGTTSGGRENIFYYMAPNRLWGYDVGLQYMPPGAASSKMQELSAERNEFYREPPADDPYICLLRATVNFPCN